MELNRPKILPKPKLKKNLQTAKRVGEPKIKPTVHLSKTNITPSPALKKYGKAKDYSWLIGRVIRTRKGIQLRYAGVDQQDRYGGSVRLVNNARVAELKDGWWVKVQGTLQSYQNISPPYLVNKVQVWKKK